MKMRKILTLGLAAILAIGTVTGCGEKKENGKVAITIGNAPTEGQDTYENYMKTVEDFNTAHPEIDMKPSTYIYDTSNFMAKAAAKQLPTAWSTYFTEVDLISEQGYCKDISENLKNTGLLEVLNPNSLEVVTGDNGEIWGIPYGAYAQGLHINKKLFAEAGLVNEDGSVKIPQTWVEVAEFASIIKEKTGQAGFIMPSINNIGGWHFVNIAWSYGTEFMKQNDDGSWKATFNSKEFKDALSWLYDAKWNKNALFDSAAIDIPTMQKYFGTYQAGMYIANAPVQELVTQYGMNKDDIMCVRMPAGPEGRVSQTGGNIIMFNADATNEEIDAAILWYMETGGFSAEVTEDTLKTTEENLKLDSEAGRIIMKDSFPNMVNRKGEEKLDELKEKYINVSDENFGDYLSYEDVQLKPEEPVACQELYAVLDGIVQEILTNKGVDIDALTEKAVSDFQANHLDNL